MLSRRSFKDFAIAAVAAAPSVTDALKLRPVQENIEYDKPTPLANLHLTLLEKVGVELDKSNFAVTHPFSPIETSRPGVYACGVFQEPKDIPSSVIEASAAACASGVSRFTVIE